MGLLRMLIRALLPSKPVYRTPQTIEKPHAPTARPVQDAPKVPFHHVTSSQTLKGKCWVIDGDTIVINRVHIRLAGIDAPELDQPYGQNAKRALMALCKQQVITAVTDGSVSHDRAVATCRLEDGRDLSAEMVKAGLALDWRKYSGGIYQHLEVDGIHKKLWRVDARQKGLMPPIPPA